jgi:CHAT domain-containing protein
LFKINNAIEIFPMMRLSRKRLIYGLLVITIAITQIFHSIPVSAATPAALVQQGKIAYEQGNFATALTIWQQAEIGYHQAEDVRGVTGSQVNQAQALVGMGLHRRACKLLANTVGVGEDVCDGAAPGNFGIRQTDLPPSLQALAANTFGDILRLLGNFDGARVTLAKAMEIAKPLTDRQKSPIVLNIANTLRDLGNRDRNRTDKLQPPASASITCSIEPLADLTAGAYYQTAIACYQQANSLTADIDEFSLLVEISQWLHHNNLNPIAQKWEQQFNQPDLVAELQTQIAKQPYNNEGLSQRINFARNLGLTTKPQWVAAKKLLDSVISQAREINQKSNLAEATGTLGWLYEQNRQWDEALKFTNQAIALESAPGNDSLYQWEWQLGRILQHQNQPEQAKAAYNRSIIALEKIRKNLRVINPDAQLYLRDNVEPLYRELVDLSFREKQPDLAKIVNQFDGLKLVELENFLRCRASEYRAVNEFAEDSGAVVFYPIILADRLEVILRLGGNKFQRFTAPVSRIQLEKTIANFRQNLTQPQYGWDDAPASQLYDWLIRPAQKYLTPQTKNLVFVMDGALQNMPVAALYDRSRQEYLIDRYPVAMTPGLKILGAKKSIARQSGILIGGLTGTSRDRNKSRGNIYEPLTNARAEIQGIKSLFGRSTELIGDNFTQDNIQRVLATGKYSIVHLATHGQFSSDPHQTFILTDGGQKIDLNGLRSILQQGWEGSIDLIVLSACETATGDKRAALGLAGVAIRNGAASTLASLWAVDDGATSELMQEFYGALTGREGVSKAEALRFAQKSIRQQHEHPYYWASFVLLGNWL